MNPWTPIDLQAHVRAVDAAVTLTYPVALYLTALLDVLEKLAADRYGCPPREPFGAFKNMLNAAARELASASNRLARTQATTTRLLPW